MPSKSMVIGASGTSGGGENDLVMESVNKTVPFQSVIRVQVQECSQSQQSSSTSTAGNIYFVKNDYVQQQQQKPLQHNGGAIIVAPTPPAALQRNVDHRQVGKTVTAIHMPVVVSTHPPPPSSPTYQLPSHQQQNQPEQQHHQDHQPRRPETPEYTKAFPVMDTTVASSVKGEPDLNIGRLRFSVVCLSGPSSNIFSFFVLNLIGK